MDPTLGLLRTIADIQTDKRLRGPTSINYSHDSYFITSYDNNQILIFNISKSSNTMSKDALL